MNSGHQLIAVRHSATVLSAQQSRELHTCLTFSMQFGNCLQGTHGCCGYHGCECRDWGWVVRRVLSSLERAPPVMLFSIYPHRQPFCSFEPPPTPSPDSGLLPLIIVGWLRIAVVMALELINDALSEIVVL